MKEILKALGMGAKRVGAAIVGVYKRYPSRCTSYVVSGLVIVAGYFEIAADQANLTTIVEIVLPILATGEAVHHQVTPAR